MIANVNYVDEIKLIQLQIKYHYKYIILMEIVQIIRRKIYNYFVQIAMR